jgi:hypothetical protein
MTVHIKYLDLDAEELGLEVAPNGVEKQLIGAEELNPADSENGHQMGECSPRSFQRLLTEVNTQIHTPEERLQLAQEVEHSSIEVTVRVSILS